MPEKQIISLRKVLLRSISKKQILILSHIGNDSISLTSVLKNISKRLDMPLSTLKLNARILKDLGLIIYGSSSNFKKPVLTETGRLVLHITGKPVIAHLAERPAVDGYDMRLSPANAGEETGRLGVQLSLTGLKRR